MEMYEKAEVRWLFLNILPSESLPMVKSLQFRLLSVAIFFGSKA